MFLIVGLGNPGIKYQNNRHNIGFQFIDFIAKLLNCRIVKNKKNNLTVKQFSNKIILAKPQTFMNLSGPPVKKLIENYKLKNENLIIVHDDLDIPLGKFKIQKAVGPQLHNGIESIEKTLKTINFLRIRIGIDNRQQTGPMNGENYVLQDFHPNEKKIIDQIMPKIFNQLISQFIPELLHHPKINRND